VRGFSGSSGILETLSSRGISEEIGVPKAGDVFFLARSASLLFEWVERRERVLPVKSREKIKLAAAYSGKEQSSSPVFLLARSSF